jgi:tetratricopeptide (TPR) repeat protein
VSRKFLNRIYNILLITITPNIGFLYAQEICDEGFANYLFKEGEYYRAITEFHRLSYSCTDSTKKVELYRNIGLCYFHGADYRGYISFIKENRLYFESNPDVLAEMDLHLGKSYYHLNNYPKAINSLEWLDIGTNNPFFDETQLFLGIVYSRTFNFQGAIKKLQMIEPDSPYRTTAENLSRSLKNSSPLPNKSPVLAGFLSAIIPGAGYMYSDRLGTGITASIVIGLLIWTISDAMKREQYGLATTAGFFGIGWYIGNIKGSVEAAKMYNTRTRHEFINKLLQQEHLTEYIAD